MTQSISLYDCMLLSVKSQGVTPDFSWCEPKPCSDKATRVLCKFKTYKSTSLWKDIFSAVIMADESDPVLVKAILWLQKRQEGLKDGFTVEYKGGEYIFVPKYIDRYYKVTIFV